MAAKEGTYQGADPLRPVLDAVQTDSARLSGSDALKYDALYPISAGWPPSKQDPFQPHDNWDAFCRRQKQEYVELDSNLREFEGVDEKLRELEVSSGELTAVLTKWQIEIGVAHTFVTRAEKAAAKAGSTSCFCFSSGGLEEKRAAAEEELRIARGALDAAEKEERSAQAKLERPLEELHRLQEQRKSAAARASDQMEILDSLFTDTSDAAEQVAEDQVARLLQTGAQIEAALTAQKEALRLLHTALLHFEGGQARLRGQGTGGLAEELRLHQAAALLASSTSAIQKALSAAPFAPGAARLKTDPGGPLGAFLNAGLPNVLHGSGGPAAAGKLRGLFDGAYTEVLALYQWHEKFVANIVDDLETNAASLVVAKKALLEERLRLVRQVSVQRQVTNTERRRSSRISDGVPEASRLDQYANGEEPGRLDW
ncbi:hypothetical protein KFL_003100070 [Klebsormidium nitens]|uniref:Uncharacterized protein n=1 Tax=Klebsormidium nitens TaxID=105231 RepID=A0A1Y1I749_KLENI|nr:hypothetical protein KFL_003100070 [Klebsormidium nitens]|eukprot:GAQ86770.1 hypothetical protein KFL_003100070 [Klebsormidium nitens]